MSVKEASPWLAASFTTFSQRAPCAGLAPGRPYRSLGSSFNQSRAASNLAENNTNILKQFYLAGNLTVQCHKRIYAFVVT